MRLVINVLVVEADPGRLESLLACLSDNMGFKIVGTGANSLEACRLPIFQKNPPDVLLVNIDQPDMSRIDIWAAIHFLLPHARIVALTSGQDDHILKLALGAGVMALHTLSIEANALCRAIRNAVLHKVDYDLELMKRVTDRLLWPPEKAQAIMKREQVKTLTPREHEIIALLGQGLRNREIAARLCLSEKTIRNYVSEILGKLELNSRTQAALWVRKHGLSEQ